MLTIDEHIVRRWARRIVFYHLEPKLCEVCGKKASAHHPDYNKPLTVQWLCNEHHAEAQSDLVTPAITEETMMKAITVNPRDYPTTGP